MRDVIYLLFHLLTTLPNYFDRAAAALSSPRTFFSNSNSSSTADLVKERPI